MRLHAAGICIRRLQDGDFEAVLGLVRQLPGNLYRWTRDAGFAQVFQDLMDGRGQEAFVATLHQRVIGFISLYYMRVLHHGGTVASIQELVVTEELRGRGVGRALVEYARSRAKELCCSGIELALGLPGLGTRRCTTRHGPQDCGVAGRLPAFS